MIGCDVCDQWYHGKCIQVTQSEADVTDHWVCPRCDANSFSNQKCRVCSSNAKAGSKYCSDKCGKEYARMLFFEKKQRKKEEEERRQAIESGLFVVPEERSPHDKEDIQKIKEIDIQLKDIAKKANYIYKIQEKLISYIDIVDGMSLFKEVPRSVFKLHIYLSFSKTSGCFFGEKKRMGRKEFNHSNINDLPLVL